MTVAIVLLTLLVGAWLLAVIEAWLTTGRLRPVAPLLAGLSHLGRESILARKPDRLFFETAPVLLLVVAVLGAAVLPLTPDLVIADLATGALFLNAVLAYVLVSLIMAGWGPNGAYAMIGGWRFLGQLIAYSMLIVMPITATAMRAESLLNSVIVESQAGLWNIVYQPLGFVLFFIAAMALAFRSPLRPAYRTRRVSRRGRRRIHRRAPDSVAASTIGDANHPVCRDYGVLSRWLAGAAFAALGLEPDQDSGGSRIDVAGWLLFAAYSRGGSAGLVLEVWNPLALLNILIVGLLILVVP